MNIFPDDIIDTRKIIERIDDLELENSDDDGEPIHVDLWEESARKEYKGLTMVAHEVGEGVCRGGVMLINEGYFTAYIRELYSEIGGEYYEANPRYARGYRGDGPQQEYLLVPLGDLYRRLPFSCIDWEWVAREEYSNYSQLEVDGTTYLYLEP